MVARSLRIVVIMGGRSSEREISLQSGANAARALTETGHHVVTMDLGEDLWDALRKENPDLVFIALHGKLGEDGTLQGMLELMGIPYTGSGVLASSLAMHKAMAKKVFKSYGLPTPRWLEVHSDRNLKTLRLDDAGFSLPVVVKPDAGGSTIGVTIVRNEEELVPALEKALQEDSLAIIEEFIPGKEVTVGVIGLTTPKPLPVIEIIPKGSFYDFGSKYQPGMSEHILPAPLDRKVYRRAQKTGLLAHLSLGCRGFSRTDLRVAPDGTPYVLEVNTLPGLTETSLLPEAARAIGISFHQLLNSMLLWALEANRKVPAEQE